MISSVSETRSKPNTGNFQTFRHVLTNTSIYGLLYFLTHCLLEHQCVESLSEVGHVADSIAPSVSVIASRENLQSLITCHATELFWLISIL